MLGVSSNMVTPCIALQPSTVVPPSPASAADALMQIMIQGNQAARPPPIAPEQEDPRLAFNFSYVNEREDQPTLVDTGYLAPEPPHPMTVPPPPAQFFHSQGPPMHMTQPMYGIVGNLPPTGLPFGGNVAPTQSTASQPVKREKKISKTVSSGNGSMPIV